LMQVEKAWKVTLEPLARVVLLNVERRADRGVGRELGPQRPDLVRGGVLPEINLDLRLATQVLDEPVQIEDEEEEQAQDVQRDADRHGRQETEGRVAPQSVPGLPDAMPERTQEAPHAS